MTKREQKIALDNVMMAAKEMRDACAAACRVIMANNLVKQLEREAKRSGVEKGFGVRFDNAFAVWRRAQGGHKGKHA